MTSKRLVAALALPLLGCAEPAARSAGALELVAAGATGTDASLRAVSAVTAEVAWASGSKGTVLRTTDGGRSWERVGPAEAAELDLRSLHAFDASTAVVASAGQPARVWRTSDAGRTWRRVHEDRRPEAFFDGLAFADDVHGLLVSDPVPGASGEAAFLVLASDDGGATWTPLAAALPRPHAGEAMFAAGDCCLCVGAAGAACAVTGGTEARALVHAAGGAAWEASSLPLRHGKASQGAFGVAFAPGWRIGVAVGGDYAAPQEAEGTAAFTTDGGSTWQPSPGGAGGFRSAVAHVRGGDATFVAVGSHGASVTRDGGRTWTPLPGDGYHALSAGCDGSVWAAGGRGRVARLRTPFGLAPVIEAPARFDKLPVREYEQGMADGLKRADLESLASWVKSHGEATTLSLPFAQAKALLDDLRTLQQSAVLLRKQNKKLRLRLAALKEEGAAEATSAEEDLDPEDPV